MLNYLSNAKAYNELHEKLGVVGACTLHITAERLVRLSHYFEIDIGLYYNDDCGAFGFEYELEIDGLIFMASSSRHEAIELGMDLNKFKGYRIKSCANCVNLLYNSQLGEYCCRKLDSYTSLEDYCGYWGVKEWV